MIEDRTFSVCPICGFSEKDFRKTLSLGCPHCYGTFAANLETMLPNLHRGTVHVGKIPGLGKLRVEMDGIEALLGASPPDAPFVDALLDRWSELKENLARAASNGGTP